MSKFKQSTDTEVGKEVFLDVEKEKPLQNVQHKSINQAITAAAGNFWKHILRLIYQYWIDFCLSNTKSKVCPKQTFDDASNPT